MSNKRIFLIHEDRIVTNLYREKFEGSGFTVDATRNVEQAQKLIEQRKPDAIIVDLVVQSGDTIALIEALRADPATMGLPILVFPNNLNQLSAKATNAGANCVITRGKQVIGSVIDATKLALGLTGLGDSANAPIFSPDEGWTQSIAASAIETINQMRHCLPGLITTPPDPVMLRQMWALCHAFSERMYFLDNRPMNQFAMALNLLMADLNEMPEQLNGSTLRTIGQSIDFLGTMISANAPKIEKDAASARILVVDDEESTLQFISAAMGMAGLRCETSESPTAALEKLEGKACDLIFLDVGLPEMNGFDLCQRIRTLEDHQKSPIVFLTGMATFQNKAQASLSGGNDFIGKPFNLPELGVKALMWLFRGQMAMI
jgi:DNA-binding response OmpR family regulator